MRSHLEDNAVDFIGGEVKFFNQRTITVIQSILVATAFTSLFLNSAQAATEYAISKATATSDDGNVPNNAIDDLLSTRWSAKGLGQSLFLDLGAAKDLGSVSISFYKGNERRTKFDLSFSSDGINYTKYGSTLTSALLSSEQSFKLVGRGRYIRFTGYGNDSTVSTVSPWNSISEISVFAPPISLAPGANLAETFDGTILTGFGSAVVNDSNVELAPGKGVNGTTAIKVLYVGNSEGSERVIVNYPLPKALEYTLNFDVNFCSGFDFAKGGKLHGLAPVNPVAGGNAVASDEWSARAMFGALGSIKTYTYHQNLAGQYGDTHVSQGFNFQPGRYHAVSYHVRVNDPAGSSNGFMRIYVDGVERVRQDNIQFRGVTTSDTMVNTLMFNTFHGGHTSDWAPRNPDGSYKTDCAYFDNFAAYPFLQVRKAPGQ